MKKMAKMFFIITLIIIVTNLNSAEINEIPQEGEIIINKEGYKLVEVLSIPWGDGENEISIGSEGEYRWGPQSFVVDNKGNIYFNDPGKRRIIKYTYQDEIVYLNKISYIAGIFNNGNIFDGRGFVYNSKGELLYKFHIPLIPEGLQKMVQHKDGSIYINPTGWGFYTLIVTSEEDKLGYRKVDIKEKVKGKYPEKSKGYPSRFFDRTYEISVSIEGIELGYLGKTGKIQKKINVITNEKTSKYQTISISVIGEDSQGNMYCAVGLQIPDLYYPKKGFSAIQKYNEKGELLLTIRRFSNWTGIDMRANTYFVTGNDDIYQLYSCEDGIKVVKWKK